MTRNQAIALAIALALSPLSLLPAATLATPAAAVTEDNPAWSCVDDGNRICGPGNPEGKPAACYDDGGVIVALWPCFVIVNPDGSSDVFTPNERAAR